LNESGPTVEAFTAAQYTATCAGDGSGTACPCGNASAVGADSGCLNSTGNGGHLEALGTASIASDTVLLRASGMPDSSALYFQGTQRSLREQVPCSATACAAPAATCSVCDAT